MFCMPYNQTKNCVAKSTIKENNNRALDHVIQQLWPTECPKMTYSRILNSHYRHLPNLGWHLFLSRLSTRLISILSSAFWWTLHTINNPFINSNLNFSMASIYSSKWTNIFYVTLLLLLLFMKLILITTRKSYSDHYFFIFLFFY